MGHDMTDDMTTGDLLRAYVVARIQSSAVCQMMILDELRARGDYSSAIMDDLRKPPGRL